MSDVIYKFSLLNNQARKKTLLYMDKLLNEQKKQVDSNPNSYREKILGVSVWNDEEINDLTNNQKHFQIWEIPKW